MTQASIARFATSWTWTLQSRRLDVRRKRTRLRLGRYAQVRSGAIQGQNMMKRGRNRIGERGCPPISYESDGRLKPFRLFFVSCRATSDVQSDIMLGLLFFIFSRSPTTNQHRFEMCTLHCESTVSYCLLVAETCSCSFTVFRVCILSVWRTTFFAYFWIDQRLRIGH